MKKYFFQLIKISVGLLLVWVLYARLSADFSKTNFTQYLQVLSEKNARTYLIFAVLLMPLNWCIESFKWQNMVNSTLSKISFFTAFKSVLSGVAFGNLTPGRASEFAGKIIFIKREERVTATYLHFVNGSSQMLVTVCMGIPALLIAYFNQSELSSYLLFKIFLVLFPVPVFLLTLFFFAPDYFFSKLKKIPFVKKQKQEHVAIKRSLSMRILFLSFVRYIVFSFQFAVLLVVFAHATISVGLMSGIILYYLFTTLLPMFSLFEALMRGGIAVMVFSGVIQDSMGVFIASSTLWLINIVLPSVLGYMFFLFLKFVAVTK